MFKTLKIKNSLKTSNLKFKIIQISSICLFAYLLICLFNTPVAHAQTTPQKGITVYPSIEHLDLATDGSDYDLTYVNNTSSDIELKLSVQDFTELEDSYKISFLEGKDASNYKYSLSSWITFSNNTLQLSPKETKSVKVFIDKNRITKGGHYASILAHIIQSDSKKNIDIKAVLSSLLFVRASTGKEVENGNIKTFKPDASGIEFPDSFILRFENSGNVHVIPYGLIEVFDPTGKLVAKGILNEGSLDALPESIRRYDIKIQKSTNSLIPGFYKAKISLHFGKSNQKLSESMKFFSQGSFDFGAFILLILIIIGIIYYAKKLNKIRNS